MENQKATHGMIQPRYGRYGITGYDAIVAGMECVFFATKRLAARWLEKHGYEVLYCT